MSLSTGDILLDSTRGCVGLASWGSWQVRTMLVSWRPEKLLKSANDKFPSPVAIRQVAKAIPNQFFGAGFF